MQFIINAFLIAALIVAAIIIGRIFYQRRKSKEPLQAVSFSEIRQETDMARGIFAFEVDPGGTLLNSNKNVEALRRMWLDRTMLNNSELGPGVSGNDGAWHISCHVAAAGGVRQASDGRLLWIEISYNPDLDQYFPSLTAESDGQSATYALNSPEAQALLRGSKLLGFVEGTSRGHISARGANDDPSRFKGWPRQQYEQPIDSQSNGGKTWEHWCTLRDIRPGASGIADSVLRAYISVVSVLGDLFPATVARGRRSFSHPKQLCAFVRAGLTSKDAALWDTIPREISPAAEQLLLEARPVDALNAIKQLSWADNPCYYMFRRKISDWSPVQAVKDDLRTFGL